MAVSSLLVLTYPAHAVASATFLDPDARVFTLVDPVEVEGEPSLPPYLLPEAPPLALLRQGAFPDGSVLTNYGRLWPSGLVTRDRFGGQLVDAAGSLLKVQDGRVVRLDARSGAVASVADVGGRSRMLIALDDGRLVVSRDEGRPWWIDANGALSEVPGVTVANDELSPIAGGRFLVWNGQELVLVQADGGSRPIARRSCCPTLTPLRDGRVLVTGRDLGARGLDLVAPDGTLTAIHDRRRRVYGNGDGAPALTGAGWLPQAAVNGSAVHAADGSLIFASEDAEERTSVRAVVPPASRRARVAFTQRAFRTFADGRVGYLAPVPGRIELEVRSHGRVVDTVRADAHVPDGELELSRRPGVGPYELRLRLRTRDGRAEARAAMDTRKVLPIADALTRLRREQTSSEQVDEGYRIGYGLRRCSRRSARRVACLSYRFDHGVPLDGSRDFNSSYSPAAWVTATLGRDGIRTTRDARGFAFIVLNLGVTAKRRQTGAIRFRAKIGQRGRAEAVATIRVRGGATPLVVRQTRSFRSRGVWNGRLRLPLAAQGVSASVKLVVKVSVPAKVGRAWRRAVLNPIRLAPAT
ncbi:hypothetical protein C8N24_6262 [Solirubrobacter pauli]|uniref:Uncharacterized protein n=1 Tax=Solirubrobacter pauli TaxID=166793 RepID=A0A660L2J9_9ACTN|nr:hypothetical protein [Solirubrobacter pauli]RKQ88221.1 hypothetical protein C8N24_6262 [Solirubrobacter pauli]